MERPPEPPNPPDPYDFEEMRREQIRANLRLTPFERLLKHQATLENLRRMLHARTRKP